MPDRPGAPPRAWQRMLSGRRLDLLDPSPLDIEIEDIAHGLARVARWNGQTRGDHAFSVAQHSLLVGRLFGGPSAILSRTERLAALLHDAPEYVLGDLISPFKAVFDQSYKAVESRLLAAIHMRFSLPATLPDLLRARVKRADQIAAYWEAVRLAGFKEDEARRFFGRPGHEAPGDLDRLIEPWPARDAERRFLEAFSAADAAGDSR